jgi:hypothetical protein
MPVLGRAGTLLNVKLGKTNSGVSPKNDKTRNVPEE